MLEHMSQYLNPLIGGLLIGLSVTIMLLFNGRVTGISGIVGGILNFLNKADARSHKNDTLWRITFVLGMLIGGVLLNFYMPASLVSTVDSSSLTLISAGLLVGFGTLLGGGCTSGHGICGLSRLSPRSLVSTGLFMFAGIAIVFLVRKLGA